MGRRLDKILEDIAGDDENKDTKAPEQPAEPETAPAEEPQEEEPEEPPKGAEPEKNADEPPAADPEDGGQPPAPKKDIPEDPVKRAEFAFKRQLSKQKEKHAAELKERDEKYEAVMKELAELKKQVAPKKEPLRREQFEDDEEFIRALQAEAIAGERAKWDEEAAKKEAERLEKERAAQAEQEELREKQQAWLNNVQEAFAGDKTRSHNFLEKVAYANAHGFGQVLDECPVAADYLINDPNGPLVFEKILTDRATFERVFDTRRTSPLAVYHELRRVEDEVRAAAAQQQPAGQGAPAGGQAVPKLGRPGRQAGGAGVAGSDMFDDPKALRRWLREHS